MLNLEKPVLSCGLVDGAWLWLEVMPRFLLPRCAVKGSTCPILGWKSSTLGLKNSPWFPLASPLIYWLWVRCLSARSDPTLALLTATPLLGCSCLIWLEYIILLLLCLVVGAFFTILYYTVDCLWEDWLVDIWLWVGRMLAVLDLPALVLWAGVGVVMVFSRPKFCLWWKPCTRLWSLFWTGDLRWFVWKLGGLWWFAKLISYGCDCIRGPLISDLCWGYMFR